MASQPRTKQTPSRAPRVLRKPNKRCAGEDRRSFAPGSRTIPRVEKFYQKINAGRGCLVLLLKLAHHQKHTNTHANMDLKCHTPTRIRRRCADAQTRTLNLFLTPTPRTMRNGARATKTHHHTDPAVQKLRALLTAQLAAQRTAQLLVVAPRLE